MTKLTVNFLATGLCIGFLNSCAPLANVVRPAPQETERVCSYKLNLDSSSNFSEKETSLVVEGNTQESLLRSLTALKVNDVPNDFASTRWLVRWDFAWRVASTGCKITSAVAMTEVNYRFPVWPQQLNITDRSLVDRWTNYSDELRARHCRYGEFGIQAAIEVEQALMAISPRRSCQRLETDANQLAHDIVGRYQKLEQKFRAQAAIKSL